MLNLVSAVGLRIVAVAVVLLLIGGLSVEGAVAADKPGNRDFGLEEDGSIPDANIVDAGVYSPSGSSDGFIVGPYVGRNQIGDGTHGSAGTGTGDYDFYGVTAPGGTVITIDIDARAEGSALDPYVWLYDDTGAIVAENDDSFVASEVSAGSRDSHLEFFVPAGGGTYYAAIGSFGFGPILNPFDPASGPGAGSEGEYEIHFSVIRALEIYGGPVFVSADAPGDSLVVDASGVALASSREIKRQIEAANRAEILARLIELPILEWTYKDDPTEARHLGPMAEDFFAAFGLGRDETLLSPIDTGGVALAAVQALAHKVELLASDNRWLRQELTAARAAADLSAATLSRFGKSADSPEPFPF